MGCVSGSKHQDDAGSSELSNSNGSPEPQCLPPTYTLYEAPGHCGAPAPDAWSADFSQGQLAGFEIELQDVQVIDFGAMNGAGFEGVYSEIWNGLRQAGDLETRSHHHQQLAQIADLRKRRWKALDKLRAAQSSFLVNIAKRTVFFCAPNGTWAGTADTLGRYNCRLEIISRALTAAEWQSDAVQADLDVLVQLRAAFFDTGLPSNSLVPICELAARVPGLVVVRDDVFVIPAFMTQTYYQFTRQLPLARVPQLDQFRDTAAAIVAEFPDHGFRPNGVALLLYVVRRFRLGYDRGMNQKEAFPELPKTPLHRIVRDTSIVIGDDVLAAWVVRIAAVAAIGLDADPSATMITWASTFGEYGLVTMGETWRAVLTAIGRGTSDPLATWSAHAYASGEDLGYGMLADAAVNDGCCIFENRELSSGAQIQSVGQNNIKGVGNGLIATWRAALA